MKKTNVIMFLSLLVISLMVVPGAVLADTKTFAYTYSAKTLPKGDFEAEHYLDAGFQAWDNPETEGPDKSWAEVDWKHQLEFEYGVTEAFDIGFYNVFVQKPYKEFEYDGVKLRGRYNFGQGRNWLIDPALYLEVVYTGDSVKFEEMAIFGISKGIFETALNLKFEQEIDYGGSETEVEHELIGSYAAGVRLGTYTSLSLEYYAKTKFAEGEYEYFVNYLGPTFQVAAGPFYWVLAVQPQLGTLDTQAAVRARSIFAIIF